MKTSLDKFYKTNQDLEKDGVDFVIQEANPAEGLEEISFKLRRFHAGNNKVKAALAAYHKPYAKQIEMGTLPTEKAREIQMKLFIDVCLVSWTGVKDEKGADIPCNQEKALELFKRLPDLYDTLMVYASDHANYKEELGNS